MPIDFPHESCYSGVPEVRMMGEMPGPHYVTLEEARALLREQGYYLSVQTLREWLRRGLLPHSISKRFGKGRPQHLFSPEIVEQAKQVIHLQDEGHRLREIGFILRQRLEAETLALARRYLDLPRLLEYGGHEAWDAWITTQMVERVREWANTPAEKAERLRVIRYRLLEEFAMIVDAVEGFFRERGKLDGAAAAVIAELRERIKQEKEVAVEA
jgi:DNA-binding transcriptional MerR regulator